MARFRNTVSGVVVDVDASAAMRLPGSWEALDAPKAEEPRKTARKRPSKKTEPTPEPEPKSDE